MMNHESWISENNIKPYLFFNAFFFGPKQKKNNWLENSIKEVSTLPFDSIVDLGCGTGTVSFCFGKYIDNVVGIDSSPTMLRVANAKKEKNAIINVIFEEADMMKIDMFQAEAAFTSSLGHILGEEGKREFFRLADYNSSLKWIFVYSPIIVKNYKRTIEGEEIIKDAICKYRIASFTDFNKDCHFADYHFAFQEKTYDFSYCFDFIRPAHMDNLLKGTKWQVREIMRNPCIRKEREKNFEAVEIMYVIEKKQIKS